MSDTTPVTRLRGHWNTAAFATAHPADHANFCGFQRIDTDGFLTDVAFRRSNGAFGVSFMRC